MKLKVILLVATWIVSTAARSNRVERQSPIEMGMRVFEDIRGNMQRTFQGIMGRFIGRPRGFPRGRHPPPVPVNPQHQQRIIQHQVAAPVFKPSTSSSFAVFHGNSFPTPSPLHRPNERPDPAHLGSSIRVAPQNQNHGKRHTVHPENNFVNHPKKGQDRFSSFVGSPSLKHLPKTTDGWVAMHSPYVSTEASRGVTLKNLTPSLSKLELNPKKYEAQIKSNQQNNALVSAFQPPKSDKADKVTVSNAIRLQKPRNFQLSHATKPRRKGNLQPTKQLVKRFPKPNGPVIRSHPIYASDVKRPLHQKANLMKQVKNISTPNSQRQRTSFNLARNRRKKTLHAPHQHSDTKERREGGTLTDNGLKIELSNDKHNEMKVSGYEFGYKIVDEHSGNKFYHAEKKEGETTKGSYKVHLPDGRIQTVDYMADQEGFHPKISFEGEAKFPKNDSKYSPKTTPENVQNTR